MEKGRVRSVSQVCRIVVVCSLVVVVKEEERVVRECSGTDDGRWGWGVLIARGRALERDAGKIGLAQSIRR